MLGKVDDSPLDEVSDPVVGVLHLGDLMRGDIRIVAYVIHENCTRQAAGKVHFLAEPFVRREETKEPTLGCL